MSNCLVCNCNRTMPLDGAALSQALAIEAPIRIHRELCRAEIGVFESALAAADANVEGLTIACTQEAPLFDQLAEASAHREVPLSFVNIRESGGWSAEAGKSTPKIAALISMAQMAAPQPVAGVGYKSAGTTLIVGDAAAAIAWADRLTEKLDVCVLMTSDAANAALPTTRRYPILSGRLKGIAGWLGHFEAEWEGDNPIDLDLCTRCNGCVEACPEGAIGPALQIDMQKCAGHRACVAACGAVGAIDFARAATPRNETFDLVFDLSRTPALALHQLPQGYFAPGADALAQALAAAEMTALVGEFEKPRFFDYNARICAHSRSAKAGCNRCIDICSTGAIAADGDHVRVEPHLCMGCGACATVCPSGAMTYAYPPAADTGARLKKLLATYHRAGGRDALILIHDDDGRALIERAGRAGPLARRLGLPARVVPFPVHHVASTGIDLWLAALSYGASQVRVLLCGNEAPEYVQALQAQAGFAQAILTGLGYQGRHVDVMRREDCDDLGASLHAIAPAHCVARPATWNVAAEKRQAIEFAVEHLARHAPARPADALIALPTGAPFGALAIDRATCTLCLSCVGACPVAALADNAESPQLRFIERNCVQCGLCVSTCPEDAITLVPRLNLDESASKPQVLNQAEPFNCVRCAKPFGTRQMIDNMTARLAAHSMFAGGIALRRLQMCADCRVVDMMANPAEATIHDIPK